MVTSKDILAKTGHKNAKTLTRWYQQGIIPKPTVATHPSGRGKIASWPDWVLGRCVRIVELMKEGLSLEEANKTAAFGTYIRNRSRVNSQMRDFWDPKSEEMVKKVEQGSKVFATMVLQEIAPAILDPRLIDRLLEETTKWAVFQEALEALHEGWNPILTFDGKDVHVRPDFELVFRLIAESAERKAALCVPLLPALTKTFALLKHELPPPPRITPAPKVWAVEGDATIEYAFEPNEGFRFPILGNTAVVISKKEQAE
jgi:hypothetical protein